MPEPYPPCQYSPSYAHTPPWAEDLIAVVAEVGPLSLLDWPDSSTRSLVAALTPNLRQLGYETGDPDRRAKRVLRPAVVRHGEDPRPVELRADAFHQQLGVVVHFEGVLGMLASQFHRHLVRSALMDDVIYLALGVPLESRDEEGRVLHRPYDEVTREVSLNYASGRLMLPFKGVLSMGL